MVVMRWMILGPADEALSCVYLMVRGVCMVSSRWVAMRSSRWLLCVVANMYMMIV